MKTENSGFTLVETMVAISLLCIAIVAPMLLTVQSLASAKYASDQITAYYLAQEAIEEIHQLVEGQILYNAKNATGGDLFSQLSGYTNSQPFTVDATNGNIAACGGGAAPAYGCSALKTNGTLYGYQAGFTASTIFTRVVQACYVQNDGTCSGAASDEVRVTVTVSWKTGTYQTRVFTLSEDLYRWVQDGSGV